MQTLNINGVLITRDPFISYRFPEGWTEQDQEDFRKKYQILILYFQTRRSLMTVNIGLNVGSKEPSDQLEKTLKALPFLYHELHEGEFEGIKERTVVGIIDGNIDIKLLTEACKTLNQVCIAVKVATVGFMIHHPDTDESYSFEEKYFINL